MRNVLVTGGSRGIGLAIAHRLAASGDYNVVAVARRESEDLGQAIRETGADRFHFRAFDLGRTDEIPAFVKELRDTFGAIYGLVNNAGIGTEGLLATMRNSEIEALIRLNVLSPIVLTKYVVRHMMADGAGRIVNISSIIASTGYNGLSVYAASKAAATGFTRSLAREVGRLGITVNAIAPGFVDTELTRSLDDDSRRRIVHGRVSSRRRRPERHRHRADGGRRQHGLTAATAFTIASITLVRRIGARFFIALVAFPACISPAAREGS
jgi:3-oxoacyl-[acyl-carrier protein] reductase